MRTIQRVLIGRLSRVVLQGGPGSQGGLYRLKASGRCCNGDPAGGPFGYLHTRSCARRGDPMEYDGVGAFGIGEFSGPAFCGPRGGVDEHGTDGLGVRIDGVENEVISPNHGW